MSASNDEPALTDIKESPDDCALRPVRALHDELPSPRIDHPPAHVRILPATSEGCAGRDATLPSHILLADRESAEHASIRDHLRQAYPAIAVLEAADGSEALKALQQHPVGFALIDRCLPGLDGGDFIRHLRKRATLFGLLSDRLVPQWADVAQAIGAYDVLLKPIRPAQLDNFVATYDRASRPANLLLIESSEKIIDVVTRMLRRTSFKLNLDFSRSARDALDMLVPELYDVAFANLSLADASGVETAFRVIARSPSTKVVTFGNHPQYTPAALKSLGVAAHLPVPFEPHALELALHDVFGLWQPYVLKAIDKVEKLDQTGVDHLFRPSAGAAP
jgi:DNA-binding response OmpR family regulator